MEDPLPSTAKPSSKSVSTLSKKKQRSLTLLENAPPDIISYLQSTMNDTPGGGEGWKHGFGRGFVIEYPMSWDASRRGQLKSLCSALGFKAQVLARKACFELTQTQVNWFTCVISLGWTGLCVLLRCNALKPPLHLAYHMWFYAGFTAPS